MGDAAIEERGSAVAEAARRLGVTVAVAESLTGGLVASALARAEDASTWFRGGIMAYSAEVKHDVLGVRPGPVVAEEAVVEMAEHVARLLGADVGLAVSGVGGPGYQDDQPPRTVWVAVATRDVTVARLKGFEGDPSEVCTSSVVASLELLVDALR